MTELTNVYLDHLVHRWHTSSYAGEPSLFEFMRSEIGDEWTEPVHAEWVRTGTIPNIPPKPHFDPGMRSR